MKERLGVGTMVRKSFRLVLFLMAIALLATTMPRNIAEVERSMYEIPDEEHAGFKADFE